MLMVIFAFLVYQTMPHFVTQRTQYEARERASNTYAWHVFVLSNLVVEIPWATLASLFVFFPFYYLVGMYQNAIPTDTVTQRGGLMFVLIWTFMIFESTVTHGKKRQIAFLHQNLPVLTSKNLTTLKSINSKKIYI